MALLALVVAVAGCGRYSFGLRRSYDRGRYGATVARCENDALVATQQWNAGHQARYHVYCGMAYLNLGDTERAASELVLAERMRLGDPRLVTGRDLARLSQGLTQLFGVPAGQLEIQEGPAQLAQGPSAPEVTVVPPAAAPEAVAPGVSVQVGGDVTGRASVSVGASVQDEPEPPAAPQAPPAAIEILAPPAPPAAPAPPAVIVIPAEDGVVIE